MGMTRKKIEDSMNKALVDYEKEHGIIDVDRANEDNEYQMDYLLGILRTFEKITGVRFADADEEERHLQWERSFPDEKQMEAGKE